MKKSGLELVLLLILAIIVSAFAISPAGADADPCNPNNVNGSITDPTTIPLAAGSATFYLEIREVMSDRGATTVFLYEEANGITNLQRGGGSWLPIEDVDTCNDTPDGPDPDKLWI